MNLTKKYPGYFNKWIFRGALFFLVVLFILALKSQNYSMEKHLYIYCPDENIDKCLNPYYVCNQYLATDAAGYIQINEAGLAVFCASVGELPEPCPVCEVQYLNPGQSLGDKPPAYVEYFPHYGFLLLALALAFNHLAYMRRQKIEKQNESAENKELKPKVCERCGGLLIKSKYAPILVHKKKNTIFCPRLDR